MSKSNSWETDILKLLFTNLSGALIGDASGIQPSAGSGSLYISLHSADPGEAGDQTTSEATFTSYARVGVGRNAAAWTVSGNSVTNAAVITFPACTGSSTTVTYFGIGTASSGAGKLLYSGAVSPSIAVTSGITALIPISGISVTED